MGAIPSSIISLIVQESVFLTTVAGGIGIGAAQLILALIRTQIPEIPDPNDMFHQPFVSLEISLIGLSVLVIGGALAGLIPALKAAKVSPIEAIRAE
jgi:putative ABC transport system permease protein